MKGVLNQQQADRFGGITRLYGENSVVALSQAHIAVVGLGGVGSWAAEALVRSGVGEVTLIELDDVCVTNTNRQLHALTSNVGKPKVQVMAARLSDINPALTVHAVADFLTKKNMRELIDKRLHVVIDATDSAHIKAALVAYCSAIKLRLVTVGSSGGKRNPQLVTVADLGFTESDPMLAKVRTQLYRHYRFERSGLEQKDPCQNNKVQRRKFRVDAVYSTEQMVYPKPDGSVCQEKQTLANGVKLDCAGGFGSSVMVTGTFGFAAAYKAIERYLQMRFNQPQDARKQAFPSS